MHHTIQNQTNADLTIPNQTKFHLEGGSFKFFDLFKLVFWGGGVWVEREVAKGSQVGDAHGSGQIKFQGPSLS